MITPSELLELELLLKLKFQNYNFSSIFITEIEDQICVLDLDFLDLLNFAIPDKYTLTENKIYLDINIFKILQLRYFPENYTVEIFGKIA